MFETVREEVHPFLDSSTNTPIRRQRASSTSTNVVVNIVSPIMTGATDGGGPSFGVSTTSAPPLGYRKILLVGDSITQFGSHDDHGWAFQLQKFYIRRADVLNRGLAGWNTRWLKQHIDQLLDSEPLPELEKGVPAKFLFATLWIGANDARLLPDYEKEPEVNRCGISVEEYADNVEAIARKMLAKTDVLLMMTPPPIAEANRVR